MNVTIRNLL